MCILHIYKRANVNALKFVPSSILEDYKRSDVVALRNQHNSAFKIKTNHVPLIKSTSYIPQQKKKKKKELDCYLSFSLFFAFFFLMKKRSASSLS